MTVAPVISALRHISAVSIFSGSTRIFRKFSGRMFVGRISDGTSYITRRFDQKLRMVRYRLTIYQEIEFTVRSSRFFDYPHFPFADSLRIVIFNLDAPTRKDIVLAMTKNGGVLIFG